MYRPWVLVLIVISAGSVCAAVTVQVKDNDIYFGTYQGVDLAEARRNAELADDRGTGARLHEAIACEGSGWFAHSRSNNYPNIAEGYTCGSSTRKEALDAAISECRRRGGQNCGEGTDRNFCYSACDTGDNHGSLAELDKNGGYAGTYGSFECYPTGREELCPAINKAVNTLEPSTPSPSSFNDDFNDAFSTCNTGFSNMPCVNRDHVSTSAEKEERKKYEEWANSRPECNDDWTNRPCRAFGSVHE